MTTITATATRWEHGWELAIDDEVVTQSRTLAAAPQQIRDYLDTIDEDTDHSGWTITLTPGLDDFADRIRRARRSSRDAARAQACAAQEMRELVEDLKRAEFRDADIAAFLDVSRGRVHQISSRA
ncbi:antitoxin HicB [Brachybacterium sp. DNPG3]